MKNVAYLIGAGASFETLPLVKDFPTELTRFKQGIDKELSKGKIPEIGKVLLRILSGWRMKPQVVLVSIHLQKNFLFMVILKGLTN
jgi:hypothetical protein